MTIVVRIPHQMPVQAFTATDEAATIAVLSDMYNRDFDTLEDAVSHDMYAAFVGESVEDILEQMSWLSHKRFEAEAAVDRLA